MGNINQTCMAKLSAGLIGVFLYLSLFGGPSSQVIGSFVAGGPSEKGECVLEVKEHPSKCRQNCQDIIHTGTKSFQLFFKLGHRMSLAIPNQVAILEGEGGGHGDEVYPLGQVFTRDTLLTMHELDRRKTCQWLRNLLHHEGVAVSI